ncbi:16613_t:CDS:2, partial [Racocetra fulgida]
VVVLTETPLKKQLEINDFTHANGIHFISTDIRGLFGVAFTDFGPRFTVTDTTGENPLTGMVAAISKDIDGIVTCLDESRHGLEDGEYVTFTEIKGMEELNDCEPRKIKVLVHFNNLYIALQLGPYTFSIGDTSNFGDYIGG